jgi:hypothetical protein
VLRQASRNAWQLASSSNAVFPAPGSPRSSSAPPSRTTAASHQRPVRQQGPGQTTRSWHVSTAAPAAAMSQRTGQTAPSAPPRGMRHTGPLRRRASPARPAGHLLDTRRPSPHLSRRPASTNAGSKARVTRPPQRNRGTKIFWQRPASRTGATSRRSREPKGRLGPPSTSRRPPAASRQAQARASAVGGWASLGTGQMYTYGGREDLRLVPGARGGTAPAERYLAGREGGDPEGIARPDGGVTERARDLNGRTRSGRSTSCCSRITSTPCRTPVTRRSPARSRGRPRCRGRPAQAVARRT